MHELRQALERIKNQAISLADAQIIALEALNGVHQPSTDSRALFEDRLGSLEYVGHNTISISEIFTLLADCDNKQYELENAFYNKPSGD